jgi:hypothetical protein
VAGGQPRLVVPLLDGSVPERLERAVLRRQQLLVLAKLQFFCGSLSFRKRKKTLYQTRFIV